MDGPTGRSVGGCGDHGRLEIIVSADRFAGGAHVLALALLGGLFVLVVVFVVVTPPL